MNFTNPLLQFSKRYSPSLFRTFHPFCSFSLFSHSKVSFQTYSTASTEKSSPSTDSVKEDDSNLQSKSEQVENNNNFGLDKLFPNPEDPSRKEMEQKMKKLLEEEVKPDETDRVFPKPFLRFYNTAALIALLCFVYGFWNAKQAEARGEKPPNYDAKLRVYTKQMETMLKRQTEELEKQNSNIELEEIKKQIEKEMKK